MLANEEEVEAVVLTGRLLRTVNDSGQDHTRYKIFSPKIPLANTE